MNNIRKKYIKIAIPPSLPVLLINTVKLEGVKAVKHLIYLSFS